ncbi:MAG: hypothetical protein JSS98_15965 [Bacteroidetes bacterium]|nr:hypothetical protein [Bacteroidota bacterium]
MLEIIILIFLCKEISKLAYQKGQKASKWKMYCILAWFVTEIIGWVVGLVWFGANNLFSVILIGFLFSFTSYLFIKFQLNKFPYRPMDDDIENIGRSL